MDLKALTTALRLDGLEAEHIDADGDDRVDHVDVSVLVDGFEEPLTIQVAPVETVGPGIGDLEMVQLFAAAPRRLDDEEVAQVLVSLPQVNAAVPIGAFGLIGEPPVVYLRHVMLVPPGEDSHRLVTTAVWLVGFALDRSLEELLDL